MKINLENDLLSEEPHVASKGQLLYLCREITEVLEASPNAHRLWYQIALRCNAEGRLVNQYGKIISFTVCAKKAGIKGNGLTKPLKELVALGLVYRLPCGGGGISITKVLELYQQVRALCEPTPLQFVGRGPHKLWGESPTNYGGSKSLKERNKKESASRSFSSWTEDSDADEDITFNCSLDFV